MIKTKGIFNHYHDKLEITSEGLHHKEYHSLPGMQISFMVIVFIVLILEIRLQIAGIIKMFKQEMPMWPNVALNVTNVITMCWITETGGELVIDKFNHF
jgi:hypothetical protein